MKPPKYSPPLTVLRCSTSADFLATLPIMMGYTVRNSVVVALFHGSQAGSAMRFDLPDPGLAHTKSGVDETIISLVRRLPDITSVAIVIYTDETFSQSGEAPRLMLAKWLERALEQEGIAVKDLCCVAADGWANYHEAKARRGGHRLDDIETSDMSFEARQMIDAPLQDITDLGALPAHTGEIQESIAQAITVEHQDHTDDLDDFAIARVVRAVASVLKDGVGHSTAADCARVAFATSQPSTWLVVLVTTAVGPAGARRVLQSHDHETTIELLNIPTQSAHPGGWSIAEMIIMFSSERIEHGRLRNVIETLAQLAAHVTDALRPGVLSLLAWAWWVGGMASPAALQLEEALVINPDSELALMMMAVNDAGPPLWIFSEAS